MDETQTPPIPDPLEMMLGQAHGLLQAYDPVGMLAYTFFYHDKPTGYLEQICKEESIEIVDQPAVWYDQDKVKEECEYWDKEGFIRMENATLPVTPVTTLKMAL